jgi:hypothetical protein
MSKKNPEDLVKELNEMSDTDRRVFFEQAGSMCDTWQLSRTTVIGMMFPSRTNSKHESNLQMCRNYIRDHGYLTRVHVLPDMAASTFRQCILKPLLREGAITDSGHTYKLGGKGQGHKVFRDKTRRYLRLIGQESVTKVTSRMSIVNEPRATAQKFVSTVLSKEEVLKVGFTKIPGFLLTLKNLGYDDADQHTIVQWCKVVEEEIAVQSESNPALKVYKVHNGKISLKTNTGVMKNE